MEKRRLHVRPDPQRGGEDRLVDLGGPGRGLAGAEAVVGDGGVEAAGEEACGRQGGGGEGRERARGGEGRGERGIELEASGARAGGAGRCMRVLCGFAKKQRSSRTEEAEREVQGKAPLPRDGVELREREGTERGVRRRKKSRRSSVRRALPP